MVEEDSVFKLRIRDPKEKERRAGGGGGGRRAELGGPPLPECFSGCVSEVPYTHTELSHTFMPSHSSLSTAVANLSLSRAVAKRNSEIIWNF